MKAPLVTVFAASAIALAGCMPPTLVEPPPYRVMSVDESMSCNAITASFRFAARRAARLQYWLEVGALDGYGYERFPHDAPQQLESELQRLDGLTDLQRTRGCPVFDSRAAVAQERLAFMPVRPRPPGPDVPPATLRTRG